MSEPGSMEKRALQHRAFLMMRFSAELDWLHEAIVAAAGDVEARVWRADDIFEAGVIIEQVRSKIFGADAAVAVCTGKNANVFYELGLAHPIHKPILVAANATDLPFDVEHYRAQLYGKEGTPERDTFRARLARSISDTIQERQHSEIRVGAQVMMAFHVLNLHRRGEWTPVPVDVVELLRRVKEYEDRGETAPGEPEEGERMLGRSWSQVQAHAEQLALLVQDFDLDAGPCVKLTEKGVKVLIGVDAWSAWERERAADEREFQSRS